MSFKIVVVARSNFSLVGLYSHLKRLKKRVGVVDWVAIGVLVLLGQVSKNGNRLILANPLIKTYYYNV